MSARMHARPWNAVAAWAAVVLLIPVARAHGQDSERSLLGAVRLTTEPALVAGCGRLGTVSDDSLKDLRRKIVRQGGNAGVLSFGQADLSRIDAAVFRCPPGAPPAPPPDVPPPPPGPPPAPPPDVRR